MSERSKEKEDIGGKKKKEIHQICVLCGYQTCLLAVSFLQSNKSIGKVFDI
jgi:hypothetical protein